MPEKVGKVCLVGAGPGDPQLITLKGLECLEAAEVVIYDRLVNSKILRYIPQSCKVIYAGKSPGRQSLTQDEINALLIRYAQKGKMVVRLKGGDPFLFGRGAEEALFLAKHRIPFVVVPGVSSAMAVPSYAGIPLTHRDYTSSVGIFTGQEDSHKLTSLIDWKKISSGLGTLVFLMGVGSLARIVRNLIKFGRPKDTVCCLVQQGTLPEQKSIFANLKTIVKKARLAHIHAPAVLIVGETVSLRDKLNWYETQPLFGKKILVTAPLESSPKLVKILESFGASCNELPLIRIKPLKNYNRLDAYIRQIEDFNWVIFTSQNGVKFFKDRLDYLKRDIRLLKGIAIASIGPKTKGSLENLGLKIDIQPKEFSQEGLLYSLKKEEIKGQRILLVRACGSRDFLAQELRRLGSEVKIAPAYRTVMGYPSALLKVGRLSVICDELKDIEIITFTSSSCVRNFFKVFGKRFAFILKRKIRIASIGSVTSCQIKRFGLEPDIEAKNYTLEGLTEAIIRYYR